MENTVGRLRMELLYLSKLYLYAFLLIFQQKKERKIKEKRDEHITACSHKYKTGRRERESE